MITQKETIMITEALGFPITGQTLRNYIRSGLVQGAHNVPGGIPGKGISTIYPMETAIESVVAKDMLTKKARKLTSAQVSLARRLGIACITNEYFSPLDNKMLINFVKDAGGEVIGNSYGSIDYTSVVIDNVTFSLGQLLSLTAEWIVKIASAERAMLLLNHESVCAGAKVIIENCGNVEICGHNSYFALRNEYGYKFMLNADKTQTAILIAEKELELRDQHTKISLSY